jgi:dihydrofolate reductase
MRVVVTEFMSLDGVVQAPGGKEEDQDGGFRHGGWMRPFFDPESMGPILDEVMEASDGLLFGRRTYQAMAAEWPARTDDPFADRINALPKHVATRTLRDADLTWGNSSVLPVDNVMGAVREMKARPGGDLLVMGSASFARALIADGFVDEYRLMILPILLGGGKRLFPEDSWGRPLELVSSVTAATGALLCTYRPA